MDHKVHVNYDFGTRYHYQVGIFDDEEIVIVSDKHGQNLRYISYEFTPYFQLYVNTTTN